MQKVSDGITANDLGLAMNWYLKFFCRNRGPM